MWLVLLAGVALLVVNRRAASPENPDPLVAAPTVDEAAALDSPVEARDVDPRPSDIAAGGNAFFLAVDRSKPTMPPPTKDTQAYSSWDSPTVGAQVVEVDGGPLVTQRGLGQVPAPGISYGGVYTPTRRG